MPYSLLIQNDEEGCSSHLLRRLSLSQYHCLHSIRRTMRHFHLLYVVFVKFVHTILFMTLRLFLYLTNIINTAIDIVSPALAIHFPRHSLWSWSLRHSNAAIHCYSLCANFSHQIKVKPFYEFPPKHVSVHLTQKLLLTSLSHFLNMF